MKIKLNKHQRFAAIASAGLLSVTLLAWNREPRYQLANTTYYRDTVPSKPGKIELRDLDEELEKLDQALDRLEKLQRRDLQGLSDNIEEELNKINAGEIQRLIDLSINSIDIDKINSQVQEALEAVEPDLVENSINEPGVQVEIDKEEVRKAIMEVKTHLQKELKDVKKVSSSEVKRAIEDAKAELGKVKETLRDEKLLLREELQKAKSEIKAARKQISAYQEMIYSMEKDQLIDTRKDYKIEYSDGIVYINNQKQPEDSAAGYGKYLQGNDIIIDKQNGQFSINGRFDIPTVFLLTFFSLM